MRRYRDQLALLVILGLLVGLFGLLGSSFLSITTLASIANRIPTLTLVACGMTLVLVIGGIDLSVGSVLALVAAIFGRLVADAQWSPFLAGCVGVGAGLAAGTLNGVITETLRVPAFIVTLGTLEAARGLAYLTTSSQTKYLGGCLEPLVSSLAGTILTPTLLLALGVVAATQTLLSRTVPGRKMVAIGTNETAASLAGIATRPIKIGVFALSGALAGLAAVCQMARLGAADPNAGSGIELAAIAAAVIGGTSLSGGRGSILSTFLGVLIIATLEAGLAQAGATEPVKRVVTGTVIIAAVLADTWRRRK